MGLISKAKLNVKNTEVRIQAKFKNKIHMKTRRARIIRLNSEVKRYIKNKEDKITQTKIYYSCNGAK